MSYSTVLKLRKIWTDTKRQQVQSSKIISEYLQDIKPIQSVQQHYRKIPCIVQTSYIDYNQQLQLKKQNPPHKIDLSQQNIVIKDNYYPWWFDVFEYKFLGRSFTPCILNCDIIIINFLDLIQYKFEIKKKVPELSIIRKIDNIVYEQRKLTILKDSPIIQCAFFQQLIITFKYSDDYDQFWFQQRVFNWVKIVKKQIELMEQALFVAPRLRQIKLLKKEYIQGEEIARKVWD